MSKNKFSWEKALQLAINKIPFNTSNEEILSKVKFFLLKKESSGFKCLVCKKEDMLPAFGSRHEVFKLEFLYQLEQGKIAYYKSKLNIIEKLCCRDCIENHINPTIEKQNEIAEKERQKRLREYQIWERKRYLSPNTSFHVKFAYFRDYYLYPTLLSKELVKKYQEMSYDKFLESKYWKFTRFKILENRGRKCSLCNSTKNINIHHRNYSIRGKEWLDRKSRDLIILCQPCHSKHHNILARENECQS